MARAHTVYRCTGCGTGYPKWAGRCGGCGAWNTLVEEVEQAVSAGDRSLVTALAAGPRARPRPIGEVGTDQLAIRATGLHELDRVLGGGLVPGSVTLVGGEPGIGKSTLLLQMLGEIAVDGRRALLVSAEESVHQVALRADRLGVAFDDLWIVPETSLPAILAAIDDAAPEVVVIDSIQTIFDPELGGLPGTVAQVRDTAQRLVAEAKQRGVAIVLVGHVTKEGNLAGPRLLEHLVDTVLGFEGDRHHALRLLRAVKHRFGSTQDLGVFEMSDAGLVAVPDPSKMFLGDRTWGVAGSVVVPVLEGRRPLLVELQALVAHSKLAVPRRTAQGIDAGRLGLILAVLEQRAGVAVAGSDVYASVVGGVRVREPGTDLAIALAVASSAFDHALPPDLVACGEVGLAGELRQAGNTARRLAEAARLGFRRAIVPESAPEAPQGMQLLRAATLRDALKLASLSGA